jgi:hypothetical protein
MLAAHVDADVDDVAVMQTDVLVHARRLRAAREPEFFGARPAVQMQTMEDRLRDRARLLDSHSRVIHDAGFAAAHASGSSRSSSLTPSQWKKRRGSSPLTPRR